jgi:hypothetical protein
MLFLGGLALVGALAAAVAWAWAPQTTSAAELDQAIAEVSAAQPGPQGQGKGQAAEKALAASLIGQTSALTGMSRQDVLAELKAGKTLADIAAGHGSSADAVVQAVAAKAKERLDKQVKNGHISQARADELLARLKTKAADLMKDTTLGQQIAARQEKAADRKVMPELVRSAAEVTGLPAGDIAGRLRDGESLTQIVTSAGKDIGAVLDKATADFRAAAENAVK